MSPPPAHGHGHSHGGFISHHTFNHQTAAPHHVNHPIVSAHQSLPSHHHTTPPTFTAARQTINGVQFQPINHNHPHSPPHPHQHTQPIITNANNGNFIEVSGNDVYISAHQQQEQQAFFSQIPSQHVLVTAYPNMNNNAPGVIDPCPGDANSGVWLGFLLGVFLSPFIAIPVALTFSNKVRRHFGT